MAGGGSIIPPLVNFSILMGGLFYVARKPVAEFLLTRHSTIRDLVKDAETKLTQAQKQNAEFSSKLKAIDAEISSMRDYMLDAAKGASLKISNESKKLAEGVVSDARRAAAGFATDFKAEMGAEFAEAALVRAEAILKSRLTGDEQARIRREFSKELEGVR